MEVLTVLAGRLLDFLPKLATGSGCTGLSAGSGGPGFSTCSAVTSSSSSPMCCVVIYYLSEEIHTIPLLSL